MLSRLLNRILPNRIYRILSYIKHNPSFLKYGINYIKKYGLKSFFKRIRFLGKEESVHNKPKRRLFKTHIQYKPLKHEDKNNIILIKKSGLFDSAFYTKQNPEVLKEDIEPIEHFYRFGWQMGMNPSVKFDLNFYKETFRDVKISNINPLLHYIKIGRKEGRQKFKVSTERIIEEKVTLENQINKYIEYKSRRGKSNIVIYTVDFDGLENLNYPNYICFDYDYICITDRKIVSKQPGIWEYYIIDYFNIDPELMKKYYMLHPHAVFPTYEKSIWIDNQIDINSELYRRIENIVTNENSIVFLSINGKQNQEIKQTFDYSILIRSHNENNIIEFTSKWWFSICKNGKQVSVHNLDLYNNNVKLSALLNDNNADSYILDKEVINSKENNSPDVEVNKLQNQNPFNILHCSELNIDTIIKKCKAKKVNIVIPIYNALSYVKDCVCSVKSFLGENHEVFLADDCSEEETRKWLKEFSINSKSFHLIQNEENIGYTANINNALNRCKADFIIILNSDTIVSKGWIEKLLFCAYSDNSIGIVGPLSNAASWQSVPELRKINDLPPMNSIYDINSFLEKNSFHPKYPVVDLINGFCIGIKREVFNKCGLFDAELFPKGYGEEDDFCLRARQKGFKLVVANHTYIYHSKSKSFGHDKRALLSTESRKKLELKYGKENFLNIKQSIENNPILMYNRESVQKLIWPFKQNETKIGENINFIPINKISNKIVNKKICVHLHLYYIDMCDYFLEYMKNIPYEFDLYISTDTEEKKEFATRFFAMIKNAISIIVEITENRGRDIAPFIVNFGERISRYDYFLHIHSKKSSHESDIGHKWLDWSLNTLLFNENYIHNLLLIFNDFNEIGVICSPIIEEKYPYFSWRKNKKNTKDFLKKIGVPFDKSLKYNLYFPAGSMFWGKCNAFKKLLLSEIKYEDFPEEPIGLDGSLAHAIERAFLFISKDQNYNYIVCQPEQLDYRNENRTIDKLIVKKTIDVNHVGEVIKKHLKNREPFALIRYFDGEGAFYKILKRDNSYLQKRMEYYFGKKQYNINDVNLIRNEIIGSVENADIIGIPPLQLINRLRDFGNNTCSDSFERLPFIRTRFNEYIDSDGVWRILSAYELIKNAVKSKSLFCAKDINYELVTSGLIYEIIDSVKEVSLITSQPVKQFLEEIFYVKVKEYLIPQKAFDNRTNKPTKHFPDVYNNIINKLSIDLSGKLFLIGAGPLGKSYCSFIKKQGGIAIDLGAVFNSWVNSVTHHEHYEETEFEMKNEYLLTIENIKKLTNERVKVKVSKNEIHPPRKKFSRKLRKNTEQS